MSRRIDRLVTYVRSVTENETANSTTDITDEEIIEYFNQAQDRIQSKIVAQHPRIFVTETTIAAVADQEEYDLPADAFLANKILSIEYTADSTASRPVYYKLIPGFERDRASHISGIPKYYIRRDKLTNATGSFLASPAPAAGGQFRVTYIQSIDNLDKRRAVVSAVTLDSGTSSISSLTFDTSGSPPIDFTNLADHEFFCVVNKNGTIKMRNIEFDGDGSDSINTSTGVVTIESGFTYNSGESIAVGDFIVGGKNTSTHSSLPKNVERYLIQFAIFKILKTDSSVDVTEQFQELSIIEQDILDSYQEIEEDIHAIPIIEDWEY